MAINIENQKTDLKSLSSWDDILVSQNQLSSEEQILQSSVKAYCQDKLMSRILHDNRNEHFSREIIKYFKKK